MYSATLVLSFFIVINIFSNDEMMKDERPKHGWHQEVKTGPLQKKIEILKKGETFVVGKGKHFGPIHIKTSGIVIRGGEGAILSANGQDSVIVVEADDVTIQNITIQDSGLSYTQADAGISLRQASNVKLVNNTIADCLFGIDVSGGHDILIQGNNISSKNLDIGLRGDAIRLWTTENSQVIDNRWSHSRDVVSWYSNNILFKNNFGSDSRYSIHSMYSKKLKIQDNQFKRNKVGIFLMYGSDFIITNNFIERALGATGMGIGLKESSNILAQKNSVTYSAVGVLVDNSPFKNGSRNWFHKNTFAFNTKAVVVNNDLAGGEFKNNSFIGNLEDVYSENRRGSKSKWIGNHWDQYIGFDQNKDSIGDTSFILKKYGESLRRTHPYSNFFFGTPLFGLVALIEEVVSFGKPVIVLIDDKPSLNRN